MSTAAWKTAQALRATLPPLTLERLPNGLTVGLLPSRRTPVVATALVYGVGARNEVKQELGAAHFLEHMMFKGSRQYPAGKIDHVTRSLGGSNNAYTSHDSTLYYFTFAADRWQEALAIEADRMAHLSLDPEEVGSERQVILEELAMYESEPWDILEQKVASALFPDHPYGRPILGTRESLAGLGAEELRDFHRRYYHPSNAVLALAGDLPDDVLDRVAEAFGDLEPGPLVEPRSPDVPTAHREMVRVERRQGEVPRMLLSMPAPAAGDPDHPLLLTLAAVLGTGRASRLHRALVDEGQLCAWATAELQETHEPGALVCALEVVPGVEPQRAEAEVLRCLDELRRHGPTEDEVRRVHKVLQADWLFSHERVYQHAFLMGTSLSLFDAEHPWLYFERLLAAEAGRLQEVAQRYLRPESGVLGWSLPQKGATP